MYRAQETFYLMRMHVAVLPTLSMNDGAIRYDIISGLSDAPPTRNKVTVSMVSMRQQCYRVLLAVAKT